MPIRFACSKCNARLSVGTRKAGRECHCPRCSASIVVPTLEDTSQACGPQNHVASIYRLKPTVWLVPIASGLFGSIVTYGIMHWGNDRAPVSQSILVDDHREVTPALPIQPISDIASVSFDVQSDSMQHVSNAESTNVNELVSNNQVVGAEIGPISVSFFNASKSKTPRGLTQEEIAYQAFARRESIPQQPVTIDVTPSKSEEVETELDRADFASESEYRMAWLRDRKKRVPQPKAIDSETFALKLREVREIGLDHLPRQIATNSIFKLAESITHPIEGYVSENPDFSGLPFRLGNDCLSSTERVRNLGTHAAALKSLPSSNGALSSYVQHGIRKETKDLESVVPAAYQILQSESTESRFQLVQICKDCDDVESTLNLAKLAVYDRSKVVRDEAITALKTKSPDVYRDELHKALRYPFQPIVQNAAVAIAELELTDSVPLLRAMLDEPAPDCPQYAETDSSKKYVRELVRIKHFANCALCHAPSKMASDSLRGVVPTYGKEIPEAYYLESSGTVSYSIRADVTYLKQDFSIKYTVIDDSKWPSQMRFDFVTRIRPATSEEYNSASARDDDNLEFKKPLVFALRRLNEIDHGDSVEAWKENLSADVSLVSSTLKLPPTMQNAGRKLFASTGKPTKTKKKR